MAKRVFPIQEYVVNILSVMAQATDDEKAQGKAWYSVALDFCVGLALRHSLSSVEQAAAIVAALSPACKWTRNMVDAENLCAAFKRGGATAAWEVSCCTYGPNKAKAIRILEGDLEALSGRKVTSFAANICKPESRERVTIDRHAWNACVGERYIKHDVHSVDAAMYAAAEEAYKLVAEQVGMVPNQVQAITWVAWRRLNNISDT